MLHLLYSLFDKLLCIANVFLLTTSLVYYLIMEIPFKIFDFLVSFYNIRQAFAKLICMQQCNLENEIFQIFMVSIV